MNETIGNFNWMSIWTKREKEREAETSVGEKDELRQKLQINRLNKINTNINYNWNGEEGEVFLFFLCFFFLSFSVVAAAAAVGDNIHSLYVHVIAGWQNWLNRFFKCLHHLQRIVTDARRYFSINYLPNGNSQSQNGTRTVHESEWRKTNVNAGIENERVTTRRTSERERTNIIQLVQHMLWYTISI